MSVFSPNVGKYGQQKTPYLVTFHEAFQVLTVFKKALCACVIRFDIKLTLWRHSQIFGLKLKHELDCTEN